VSSDSDSTATKVAKTSVIVVNFRTPELTERAVRSAIREGADQVIVVDNGSDDGSANALKSLADRRVEIIQSVTNVGFGAAANMGALRASADWLIFLNSDAELQAGALAPMVQELTHRRRVVVGPQVVNVDGSVQRSAGMLPRPLDLTIRAMDLHLIARAVVRLPVIGRLADRTPLGREYAASTNTETVDVSMVSGSCFGIGEADFHALGGFDDRYFMYFEDADLCRRASLAGMRIRFVPAARVQHKVAASTEADWHFGPLHGPSMVVYLRRWHGRPGGWLALTLLVLRAVAQTILARPGAIRARAAARLGARAYREGRSRDPSASRVPTP
jgi:GT2 family glycosyltransferase